MRKSSGDILIEFIQQGNYIKVSAVDARSGLEVSIVGDAKQPRCVLEAVAVRKLIYVRRHRLLREANMTCVPRKYRLTSGWDM